MTTSMKERTNTLLYKNISLTLYSRKGWCWLCVRGELETGTDCYILTQVLLTIAALLSHLGWVARPWVTEGLKPSVCRWFSIRHLIPNWLQLARTASGTWLYNCLTSTCFCCPSAYLHKCISWLTAQSIVNMLYSGDTLEAGIGCVVSTAVVGWILRQLLTSGRGADNTFSSLLLGEEQIPLRLSPGYLSLPSFRQDLTQGLFYRKGEVGHEPRLEPRLEPCWAYACHRLSAMGARWACCGIWTHSIYYVSPTRMTIHSLKTEKRLLGEEQIPLLRVKPRYLSLPPIRQDSTQGLSYSGGLMRGRSGTSRGSSSAGLLLVIGSFSAMWIRWANCWTWTHSIYFVSPTHKPAHSLN